MIKVKDLHAKVCFYKYAQSVETFHQHIQGGGGVCSGPAIPAFIQDEV